MSHQIASVRPSFNLTGQVTRLRRMSCVEHMYRQLLRGQAQLRLHVLHAQWVHRCAGRGFTASVGRGRASHHRP